jgi:hypothetical protein
MLSTVHELLPELVDMCSIHLSDTIISGLIDASHATCSLHCKRCFHNQAIWHMIPEGPEKDPQLLSLGFVGMNGMITSIHACQELLGQVRCWLMVQTWMLSSGWWCAGAGVTTASLHAFFPDAYIGRLCYIR